MNYIEGIFSDGGLLSQELHGYQERKTQIEMAQAITDCISNKQDLVVEAPTGCGKSMGYLIPAIYHIKNNNLAAPIVVATAKKVLQKQLIEKDLPFLRDLLSDQFDFQYSLIKGRNNYICNKKFNENVDKKKYVKGNVTTDELESFNNLKSWYSSQLTAEENAGDIDGIEFDMHKGVLEANTISDNECTGGKCPFKSECFANQARKGAANSNILVVNYHILILDLQIKMLIAQQKGMESIEGITGILPSYNILILDEAHRLVEIVRDFSSFKVSRYSLKNSVERLHTALHSSYNENILDDEFYNNYKFKNSDQIVKNLKLSMEEYSSYMYNYMKSNNYEDILSYEDNRKFDKPNYLLDMVFDIVNVCDDLKHQLKLYLRKFDEDGELTGEEEKEFKKIDDRLSTVEKIQNNFIEFRNNLESVYEHIIESPTWIDKNYSVSLSRMGKTDFAQMIIQPIYVKEHIQALIYDNMKTTVATSATLRTGYDFAFFRESTGFQGEELALKSEFDLRNQMTILVDGKMPNPSEQYNTDDKNSYQKYMDVLCDNTKKIIERQQGGTLILATSIKQVEDMKDKLEEETDYRILSQYDHFSLPKILNDFRSDRNSCLIGTNSLWEGIDVPGESLNSIVICKLPFKHIKDPISKSLEMRGNSSFFDYVLPNAVISFVQGLGRLIRNENDSGIIYIADPRVINKGYGRNFLTFFVENGVNITHL